MGVASCDKPGEEADRSKANPDANPRTKRLERPPLESQGTRGSLQAALKAARKLEAPEQRDKALMEIGWKALELAPDLTAEAIRELSPENPDAATLIQACLTHLMKKSPEQAAEWVGSLKGTSWITVAREQLAMRVAESDPKRAIQLLVDSNHRLGEPGSAMEQVLQTWTGKAPGDAALWASRLPAGESRNAVVKTVVSQWLFMDAAASTAWVASLRDPTLRKESIQGIVELLKGFPPPLMAGVLQSADSGIRSEVEHQIEVLNPAIDNAPNMPEDNPAIE
jgi:hypothetical protein